ncbi:Hypothetical protein, putative [Bodo saltans]|uniref:Uncharacterized protein n=1 Tax=Bodo saltans TaxID=75058 RepID=A0A0S4JHD8_BODSA|nr:Hypothetical protein, putative [Bodo saltans]|eukprot:CUG89359.1 Hypothetical protein, putative [Bodo saltans]
MSSITVIKNTPVTGAVNSTVMVEWKFGYDVPWEPTTNDELRLLTTSGVLVSRVSLRDAHQRPYPHGSVRYGSPTVSHPGSFAGGSLPPPATTTAGDHSPTLWGSWSSVGTPQRQDLHLSAPLSLREACCTLPTAPFGGSFVIAFIDCNNNFKRVYTVPYRIVGPEYLPSITLHLHPHPSHLAAAEQERQREDKPSSSLSSQRLSARAQAPSSSRSLMKESIDKSTILIGKNTNINDTTDDASMRLSARASIANNNNNNNNNNSLKALMKGAEGSLEFSAAAATPSREEVHPHERLTVRFDAGVILDVLNTLPTLTNGHHQTSALGTDGGGDSSSSSVHPLRGGGKHQPLSSSDIALRLASTSSFRFIVCKAQLGDNLGFSAFGVGIFDHCASVSRVPAQAFEAILEREQRSCHSSHHHADGPLYHTVSLMAPSEEGEYEIRLAVIPAASGLPYSIARSMSFRVLPPQPLAARGRLFGSLTLSKDKCMAGEPLTLSYEVLSSDTHLLSRLDSVGFLPYGRPEAFAHPDAMYNSIMEEVGNKTLSVRAPTEPGVFEGAVYSFLEQQPVMLSSSPLVVLPPKLVVELFEPFVLEHGLQSRSTLHGKAVWGVEGFTAVFQVLVPACLCHPRDRLVIVDEGSNVVHQARVPLDVSTEVSAPDNLYDPAEYQGCFTNMKKTTVEIRHPIPGKYSVHYYSFNNGRFIYQAPLYLDFLSTSRHHSPIPHLPTGAISVLNTLPDDAPIEVMFKKEGADARPASMQKMDCVCLYLHGTPDVSCAPFLDATSAAPYLAVFYLRGSPSETFFLPSLDAIRRAVRNTMHSLTNGEDDGGEEQHHANTIHGGGHGGAAATNGTPGYGVGAGSGSSTSPLRGSISGSRQQARMITRGDVARNSIRKATANPVLSWFFTPELLAPPQSSVCGTMASVDGHHQRLCLSEALVSIVARSEVPTTFRAVPLRQVAVRELAMISHRHTSAMTDGSISAVVTPVAMGRRGATGSPSASMMSRSMFSAAKGALRFLRDQDHDFRGAILAPRSCDAVDSIVVTFHITEGMPRVEDQLLLFSVGGTTPIVSCLVSLATDARPDLSLGTLLLKSPMLEGSYVVGYFSTKYNGVVLTSEPGINFCCLAWAAPPPSSRASCPWQQDGGVRRPPRVIGDGGGSVGETQPLLSSTLSPSANIALLPPPVQVRLPRCRVLLVGVSMKVVGVLNFPGNYDVEAMSNIARKYFVREDVNCRYGIGGGGSAAESSSSSTTNNSSNTADHLIRVLQEWRTISFRALLGS